MTDVPISRRGAVLRPATYYWRNVRIELGRDQRLYVAVAAYMLAAAALAFALGQPGKLVFLDYGPIWLRGVATAGLVYLGAVEIPASILADPSRPLARLVSRLPLLLNPRFTAGCGLILALILFNGAFTSVKNLLPSLAAYSWDVPLADIDRALHGGRDPWRWLQPVLGHHLVTRVIQFSYTGGWMIALCALTALVAVSRRADGLRMRFFATYAFCWIVLGNLAAGAFMSAGPAFYGAVTGDAARFGEQMAYLAFSDHLPHSSYELQRVLWSLHSRGQAEAGTGIAAFPSLHVAMATLFALTGWSLNRWAGWIATAFLGVILLGSVHLAWHYAIDGYISMLAAAGVWFAIGAWQHRRQPG